MYCIIFSSSSFITIQSQSVQDTILASQLLKKGDSLLTYIKFEESITQTKKALSIYEKTKNWEKTIHCYNILGECHRRLYQFDDSKKSLTKALKLSKQYLSKDHYQKITALKNIGEYNSWISKPEIALPYLEEAIKIALSKKPNPEDIVAKLYGALGHHYLDISDYGKSKEFYLKAIKVGERVFGENHIQNGVFYNNLGNVYSDLGGQNDKAIEAYKSFEKIVLYNFGDDHKYLAFVYQNIGNAQSGLKQTDRALKNFNKALPIFFREHNKYGLLKVHHGLGNIFSAKGQYHKAIDYFKKSIFYSKQLYGENDPNNGYNYLNIGTCYQSLNEYDKSLVNNKKALQIFKNIYGENHRLTVMAYANLGNIRLQQGAYEEALKYYHKSHEISQILYTSPNEELADSFKSFAWYYYKSSDYKQAISYQKRALKEQSKLTGILSESTVEVYNTLGEYYQASQNHEMALKVLDSALLANSFSKKITPVLDLSNFQNKIELLSTCTQKATVLFDLYKNTNTDRLLKESIRFSDKADDVIDEIRLSYLDYEDKLTLSEESKELYTLAINTNLILHKETNDSKALAQAFYYAEKSRANTLKELLNSTNAKEVSGISQALLEKEKDLHTNRAFYQSQLLSEQSNTPFDTAKIRTYENQLFDIDRKQDSLALVLEREHPKYHQLKYKNTIVPLEEVQQKLTDNQTFLEFFTSDSTTYAFVITKNDLQVTELKTPKLSDKIDQFQKAVVSKHTSVYKKLAHPLYQELIAPIKDQLQGDELIIAPDESLWHLSFELLLSKQADTNNPKEFPYVLKDYAISYANSANLLFHSFQDDEQKTKKREVCLAFSYTDTTSIADGNTMSLATLRDVDTDLPGTREEIKAIADIIEGQYYFGSEAIEKNFKKDASQYSILHLALHGEVDNEHPENSKLYFTKSKDSLEDNRLYSHELFALDIPAELTVLSACNTGAGKIAKGEGIMSLGTAFQYAGSKSLLLTSWEVSDQTTPALMKLFYTHLKKGMNKSKALQQAKLQYLNTADIQRVAPFYWGGFYLVGDTVPIKFANDFLWLWSIGLGLLGILLVYFLTRVLQKRKKSV